MADPLSVDGPAPRAYIAPTAFEQAQESMSENGRRPERIRRGRPLPSRPLREHRGRRSRARFREKNAPLRSKMLLSKDPISEIADKFCHMRLLAFGSFRDGMC